MLLWFLVPVIEKGLNNKPSFSRDKYNLYSVYQSIDFNAIFSENKQKYAYLTIKGALILARLASADKIGLIAKNIEISTDNNNFGVNGEITIEKYVKGFTRATKQEDKNGIDGFFYNEPVQIKSCVHGLSEYVSNILDGNNKKSGISVINASISDLYNIIEK